MDLLTKPSNSRDGLKLDRSSISTLPNQNFVNGFRCNNGYMHQFMNPPNIDFMPPSGASLEVESPEDGDTSKSILRYIREILMEEDLDEKNCMLQDCLALQAAEKSFYEAINPPTPDQLPSPVDHDVEKLCACSPQYSSSESSSSSSCNIASNSCECNYVHNLGSSDISAALHGNSQSDSYVDLASYCTSQSVAQLGKGIWEHSEFRCDASNSSCDLENNNGVCSGLHGRSPDVGSEGSQQSPTTSKGKKNHEREDSENQRGERSNKQSALFVEEADQSQLFDEVLLCRGGKDEHLCTLWLESTEVLQPTRQAKGSGGKRGRRKKRGNKGDMVDLWTLLTQCAQSVASNDHRSANELLKQIRQHSSPHGNGTERLAHYFANGLEARLAGSETPSYSALLGNGRTSAAEILKAYQVYVQACPFKRMSNFFANRTIMKKTENAMRIHIIDFGILYGFQWPCFIQRISKRHSGPPKLRMTMIELPQPGFRPSERVEETKHRLENYCKRFNVEYEFHVIAKKWETIQLEELNIDREEMTIVNCLYRLKNLPDESVVMNSPRDAVLKLIRKINPDMFVHGVVNGTYNAPFFVTRFREALFHFSSLFDAFDVNIEREDPQRLMFEKEVFARDAMNVIACEGFARVERPETYKQWQVRNMRAGFRQIPLDSEIFKKVKEAVRIEYHKDFIVDQDGKWMLLGWKGRVIHAVSCWVPG